MRKAGKRMRCAKASGRLLQNFARVRVPAMPILWPEATDEETFFLVDQNAAWQSARDELPRGHRDNCKCDIVQRYSLKNVQLRLSFFSLVYLRKLFQNTRKGKLLIKNTRPIAILFDNISCLMPKRPFGPESLVSSSNLRTFRLPGEQSDSIAFCAKNAVNVTRILRNPRDSLTW
jgi:hypothetical protein